MAVSSVRFGQGVTREVGFDLADLGAKHVLVVTDPTVARCRPLQTVLESLEANRIRFALYDRVRVEPTDESFLDAIAFARAAVRSTRSSPLAAGRPSIRPRPSTSTRPIRPDDFLDYVNPPIGKGLPVPGPLKPLIAIPTTAGTGSETTGVSIFDLTQLHAKTGIANRRLKPTLGLLDPDNTRTMPSEVAASSGLDILSHAIESFTAMPFTGRPRPDRPSLRPAYQGSNPISDVWSLQALRMVARLHRARGRRSVRRRSARADAAGGVVRRRRVRECRRAPAAWHVVSGVRQRARPTTRRATRAASARAARHVGDPQRAGGVSFHGERQSRSSSAGRRGAGRRRLARARGRCGHDPRRSHHVVHARAERAERPRAIGYTSSDIPALVEGTLPQHRVTKLSPRPAGPEDLAVSSKPH